MNAVRERTHWKSSEIRPRDPVLIGLSSQLDLDAAVIEARAAQKERESREVAAAEEALAAPDQDDCASPRRASCSELNPHRLWQDPDRA